MSALLLAPYNDSMRLGQGYNSFLQTPCIHNAVRFDKRRLITEKPDKNGVSQVVSYTSRFVDKISDVVRSMNISAGSSIRNGSITASGSSLTIDEQKFSSSDLNVVVSIKVINQCTKLQDDAVFKPDPTFKVDSSNFQEIYGDCFISGFVEGGDLHGIISMKVLDISRKEEIKNKLKGKINNGVERIDFTLGGNDTPSTFSSSLSQTETTISVNWSGGGQIKPEDEEWSLDTLFQVAGAFPAKVAKCPQRTWAILTKYTNNRDFVDYSLKNNIKILDYSRVQSYASDLLDMYMEYKNNLATIQRVLAEPDAFRASYVNGAINVSVKALVEERKKMKKQMTAIVGEIDKLNKSPESCKEAEDESKIESPEVWATKLPVPKRITSASGNIMLNPQATLRELNKFAFIDGPFITENPKSEVSPLPDTNKGNVNVGAGEGISPGDAKDPFEEDPPLPICSPEIEARLNQAEQEFVNSIENRRLYRRYRIDVAQGTTINGVHFWDCITLSETMVPVTWPTRLVVQMVSWGKHTIMGLCKLEYDQVHLTHGSEKGQCKETMIFELAPDERINEIRMGKADWVFHIEGISFIEISTSKGMRKSAGKAPGINCINYAPPPGFPGLKGFFGMAGDVVARLGPIWGA